MNYSDLTILAVKKLLNHEIMNEEELQALKDYLTGYASLPDMDDQIKQDIQEATIENVLSVVQKALISTVRRTFEIRYQMPKLNMEEYEGNQ